MKLRFTIILLISSSVIAAAQPKSVGGSFSYKTIAVQYDFWGDSGQKTFHSMTLGLDIDNQLDMKDNSRTGGFVRYNYNFILFENENKSGKGSMFIGPGVTLGYVSDISEGPGPMAGVGLDVGYQFSFFRAFELGVKVNPVWAYHFSRNEKGDVLMSYYKNAVFHHMMPEVSIKYNFSGSKKHGKYVHDNDFQRITYGFGFSMLTPSLCYVSQNYVSPEGYRVDRKELSIDRKIGTEIDMHVGINLNKNENLSLVLGYASGKINPAVSTQLGWKHLFRENMEGDRAMTLLGVGPCFTIDNIHKDIQPSIALSLGGGYRINASKSAKVDFIGCLENAFSNPSIYHDGTKVEKKSIGRNFMYSVQIKAGIIVTL